MQTIAVQIQDNYVENFMSYVNNHSENNVVEVSTCPSRSGNTCSYSFFTITKI